MSDYAAVGTTDSNKYDTSSAFADALQRARQIAAKIQPSGTEPGHAAKRPHEEMERLEDGPEKKKIAAVNDPFGAQLAAMHQQRTSSFNAMIVENWKVPDKMVGLIIGRGGEQIGRLQTESGCKIQMAADSGGHPDRTCTLSGTRHSIEKAKDLINQIINRGGPNIPSIPDQSHLPDGHSVVEIMIPGGKVGLVIGKGGETIRNLQERAGVKMVMIQDGPQQSHSEKPLRISGEPQKCEFAKQMIMDLITEKELESVQRSWPSHNDYGSGGVTTQEVMVPRQAVGVVIGKQGEMIKRIQQETGAKVQFQNNNDDSVSERVCSVTGLPDQCAKAASFITDLIQSVLTRDQQIGRGRGRGRPFDNQNGFGGRGGDGGPGRGPGRDVQEIQYSVPANKCGLVIGKGGETIRNINQQSGAHVELSRDPPPSHHEKVFVIRGNPQQVEMAQQLINERVGGGPMGENSSGSQPNQGYNNHYSYQQSPQGPAAPGYNNQNWNNSYHYPQSNSQNDSTADANAAAWAAYYAQMYNQQQPGAGPQPGQPQSAPAQQPTQPGSGAPLPPGGSAPAAAPAAGGSAAPGGAQPDYSAAWAEYYRSLGMYREAEMIEQQARANQQAQANQVTSPYGQQPQQPYPPGGSAPPTGGPGPQGAGGPPGQPGPAPPGQQAPPPGGGPAGAPVAGAGGPPPQNTGATPYGAAGAGAAPPPAGAAGAPQWGAAPGYPQQQQQQPAYGQPQYAGYSYSGYGGQQ